MENQAHWTPDTALRALHEYYTVPGSAIAFAGPNKIYHWFNGVLSSNQIKDYLHTQNTYTLHSEKPKKARSNVPVIVYSKRELLELDLLDISHLASYNDQVKFILVVLDAFTR